MDLLEKLAAGQRVLVVDRDLDPRPGRLYGRGQSGRSGPMQTISDLFTFYPAALPALTPCWV